MIISHWIGDFVLQTREMVDNKSTSNYYLSMHVFAYSIANIILWMIFMPMFGATYTKGTIMLSLVLMFSMHWVTDYFTSKQTSKLYKQQNIHGFFTMIGFDQILHYLQLFAIYQYVILQN
jgi:hypothetical protein